MKHASLCYVPRFDKQGLVLGAFNQRFDAWSLPGGKVEKGESLENAAERELFEETMLVARHIMHVYSAIGTADPSYMVHVFQVDAGPSPLPMTREPGNTIAWVTPAQLCESKAFGAFYQKFFRSRGVKL